MTRQPLVFSTATIAASPAAGAETVVAILSGVSSQYASDVFKLHGYLNILPDTDGTDVLLTIRRNNISGAIVAGPVSILGGITAGQGPVTVTVDANDAPGQIVNGTYVLTCTVVSADTPSVCNLVSLSARVD